MNNESKVISTSAKRRSMADGTYSKTKMVIYHYPSGKNKKNGKAGKLTVTSHERTPNY